MAFTVEDGTGVAGANCYQSIVDLDAWHTDRGNTAWTGTEAVKQAAGIEATDYLTAKYKGRWRGYKTSDDQGLDYPRSGVTDVDGYAVDSDELPRALLDSHAYLSLQALSGELLAPLERAMKNVRAGSVAVEWEPYGAESKRFPLVDGWLNGLVYSPNSVEIALV